MGKTEKLSIGSFLEAHLQLPKMWVLFTKKIINKCFFKIIIPLFLIENYIKFIILYNSNNNI